MIPDQTPSDTKKATFHEYRMYLYIYIYLHVAKRRVCPLTSSKSSSGEKKCKLVHGRQSRLMSASVRSYMQLVLSVLYIYEYVQTQ